MTLSTKMVSAFNHMMVSAFNHETVFANNMQSLIVGKDPAMICEGISQELLHPLFMLFKPVFGPGACTNEHVPPVSFTLMGPANGFAVWCNVNQAPLLKLHTWAVVAMCVKWSVFCHQVKFANQ